MAQSATVSILLSKDASRPAHEGVVLGKEGAPAFMARRATVPSLLSEDALRLAREGACRSQWRAMLLSWLVCGVDV